MQFGADWVIRGRFVQFAADCCNLVYLGADWCNLVQFGAI